MVVERELECEKCGGVFEVEVEGWPGGVWVWWHPYYVYILSITQKLFSLPTVISALKYLEGNYGSIKLKTLKFVAGFYIYINKSNYLLKFN